METAVPGKQIRGMAVFFLITYCAAIGALGLLLRSNDNTLIDHPEWSVSKRRLEMQPFGSTSYLTGPQALAHNRLNLHPLHGYHEVMLREAMQPAEARFGFRLAEDAYVTFLFNRESTLFGGNMAGIRLSLNPAFPSAFLIGSAEGAFHERIPLDTPELRPETWHHCHVSFSYDPTETNTVQCHIDGQSLPPFHVKLLDRQHMGFRGGFQPASVDDAAIRRNDGTWFREDFANRQTHRDALLRAIRYGLWALAPLLALLRWLTGRWHEALSWAAALNLCAVPAFVVLFLFQTHIAAERYPVVTTEIEEAEDELRASRIERLVEEIQKDVTLETEPGIMRIMFVGTSQTRGEGASVRENGFVPRLEHSLNQDAAGGRVECLNVSVSGDHSTCLFKMYREIWLDYRPRLTVVNLSVNDQDPDVFAQNLRDLVQLNREHGIDTIFVLEATTHETYEAAEDRRIAMRQAGNELDIPIIDSHGALIRAEDTGFLWWDPVHPTDYGHELIANTLLPHLRQWLLENAVP
jgi:lysophospholipase L1-like esterase